VRSQIAELPDSKEKMLVLLIDVLGYIGMALLLLSFALLTLKKLRADDWRYPLMNLVGAAFVAVNVGYYGSVPAAILNTAWFVIGVVGFVNARRRSSADRAGVEGSVSEG